jgi:hypothetical protein
VVTLIIGKHILHFGGELPIYQNNSKAWGNLNAGTMGYTGIYTASTQGDSSTGAAYADFLLGQTQSWSANETPEYGGRMKLPQLFVQNDYKLRPKLKRESRTAISDANRLERDADRYFLLTGRQQLHSVSKYHR